jgi:hypothetical protein
MNGMRLSFRKAISSANQKNYFLCEILSLGISAFRCPSDVLLGGFLAAISSANQKKYF